MKPVFLVLLLAAFLSSGAQENATGRINGDTLILTNGAKFVIGDKLKLGTGSNINKNFVFITSAPNPLAPPNARQGFLPSTFANGSLTIKKFKEQVSKKSGTHFTIILGGGGLVNLSCQIVAAMENGEVIVDGINDKETLAAKNNKSSSENKPSSVADELAKLKKLYDDGTLTKEEYESQKKKLLEK